MGTRSEKAKIILTTIAAVNGLAFSMGPQLKLTAEQIALAWESKDFRSTLSAAQLSSLPENPAGDFIIKLRDKGDIQFMARSTSDDCRTTGDSCRSTSDDCRSTGDGCRSTSDSCSTQFGGCAELA